MTALATPAGAVTWTRACEYVVVLTGADPCPMMLPDASRKFTPTKPVSEALLTFTCAVIT
jgi:hypothetical protein